MNPPKHLSCLLGGLALTASLIAVAPSAHANVYATNIKINGTLTGAASVNQGSGGTISYILNDAASAGVTIKIFSGNTAVRTISIAGGNPGTVQGLNSVAWDGKDDSSVNLPLGNYTLQITAASSGYAGPGWTQIINNTNNKVYWPSGVAVDTSPQSPYYGRVMVANGVSATQNVSPHPVGIVKFNADGSEADEGQSNAGNPFRTDPYLSDSCRSLKYGADDRVYFDDWVGDGKCIACDMLMTTNQTILDTDLVNGPTGFGTTGNFADIDVTDPGTTNALVWFADGNYPPTGVWCWPMTNNGVADPGFSGINVAAQGPDIPLRSGYGMEIDEAGDIFIGEVRGNSGDPTPRLTSITNVWGASYGYSTNWWNNTGGYPIVASNLGWQIGQADDTMEDISAVAIDSRTNPKYVSAVFSGGTGGGMRIVNAADGTLVTNINQGVGVFYIGTGWDAVGNVYAGNANQANPWQVFSPPGPNQATTPAVVTIQVVTPPTIPHITSIQVSGSVATIQFTGGASDPASAFTLLSSGTPAPLSSYSPAAGASITGSGGNYQATVATSGAAQFYRIKR